MKLNKVAKTFNVSDRASRVIDLVSSKEFDGNRSALFGDMFAVWYDARMARKRAVYLKRDREIAQLIAEAQAEGPLTKKETEEFFDFMDDAAKRIKDSGQQETEEEIVESIKLMRKERKDAFTSGS